MRVSALFFAVFLLISAKAVNIDPATRLRLALDERECKAAISRADDGEVPPYRPLILQVDGDFTVDSLLDLGVIIYHRRDDLLLTSVPRERLADVLALDGLLNAAVSASINTCMDVARQFGRVDAVQAGTPALSSPYMGKGVVTGFSDVGFDPHHIAFRGHVAGLYDCKAEYGIVKRAETESEIEAWITDNPDNYHATHVGNILAGSYMESPYYGVAPGSELFATTSDLHDVGILSGVEEIIAYAKACGKRTVVNLSLSSYLGPHDGSDLMCQYLSRCAKDAIICISAGNTGNVNCFATQNLDQGVAGVVVNDLKTWQGFDVAGYTDIWSDSDAKFELSLQVFDKNMKKIVYQTPWVSDEGYMQIDDTEDEQWAQYMTGLVMTQYGWSELNGRYNAIVYYDIHSTEVAHAGNWSRYALCMAVRKADGEMRTVSVDFFSDATRTFLGRADDLFVTKVSSKGSINNMCTAQGVIGVGMASSRNKAPLLPEGELTWSQPVDNVTIYSSYSDVASIEPLPKICGPGYYVVSAMSTPYLQTHPDTELSAVSKVDGSDYYWFAASGTSMSSPFVAGVIATWLEADPTLEADEILDILCQTARRDFDDIDNPRWGYGCVDALAGIKEVIARANICSPQDYRRVSVTADRRLEAVGVDLSVIEVYDVSGIRLSPTSALTPGLIIVCLPDSAPQKLLVQ